MNINGGISPLGASGRLTFSNKKFCGRKFELIQLRDAYGRLTGDDTDQAAEMVLIGGYPGTGKTRLVEVFRDRLVEGQKQGGYPRCYFLSGKSDELLSSEPFSSLSGAFSDLCSDLLKNDKVELSVIRESILEAVGNEGEILTNIIPGLVELIGPQPDSLASTTANSINRFKYIFQRFVRAVSTRARPVVLFLDDLQWSDAASLDLIATFITDPTLRHFMFIGSYRDNEVDDDHPLTATLDTIRNNGKAFVTVTLGNLALNEITEFVGDTLLLEPSEAEPLSNVLFKKTHGNIFYTMTSLQMLERKQILTYSYATFTWSWDLERLCEEMDIADNVVSLVLAKLESLSPELQTVLSTAAFLRWTFDIDTLRELLRVQEVSFEADELVKILDQAVAEGLLENAIGSPKYKFVHDRVRQAAMMLVTEDRRDEMSFKCGLVLSKLASSPRAEAWILFAAVDHLDSVPMSFLDNNEDWLMLINLNLRAGERAAAISAFTPASQYFCKGIELLESDERRWESRYDLCLRLYNAAANVELCIGSFDRGQYFVNEVLNNARVFEDKLHAYMALSEGLGQREKHADALEIDQKILGILGWMPKRPYLLQALMQLTKMKSAIQKLSDEEILGLPCLKDKDKLMAMATLAKMSVRAFYCNRKFLSLCCTMRVMKLTLKYGLSPASAYAFSGFGVMLWSALGDAEAGRRMNYLAMETGRKVDAREYEAKILFNSASYIDSWHLALPRVNDTFNRAYQAGMESGDIEFGFLSLAAHNSNCYAAGLPLVPILEDCEMLYGLLKLYNVDAVAVLFQPFRELLLSLIGHSQDPFYWASEPVPVLKTRNDMSLTYRLLWTFLTRMQLAYYLGEILLAERMRINFELYSSADLSFVTTTTGMFFSGLIATAMFRKIGMRKYKANARKVVSDFKKLMKSKGLNNLHKYLIIQADFAATFPDKKNYGQIKEEFDKAISAATKSGFMHDAALANELAGEYFIRSEDLFWAKHYFTSAHSLYLAWGAKAKVRQLMHNRGSFVEKGKEGVTHSATRKARTDMTSRVLKMHSVVNLDRQGELSSSSSLMNPEGSSYGAGRKSFVPVSRRSFVSTGRKSFTSTGSIPRKSQSGVNTGVSFESSEIARMQKSLRQDLSDASSQRSDLKSFASSGSESKRSHTGQSSGLDIEANEIVPIQKIISRQQNLTESTIALSDVFTAEQVE